MSDRLRFKIRPDGLGIIILQISFFLATRRPVEIFTPSERHLACDLKRIFKIPDQTMMISQGQPDDAIEDLHTDELGIYVPYFHSDVIRLYGRDYSTARKNKPCIALAMHHGTGIDPADGIRSMPYNKFATADEYAGIFKMIDRAGYDVITLNNKSLDVEQKIFLLNEFCDCVIGYEGGIGHLAHLLKIPYIVLPWRFCDDGAPARPPGVYYEPHRYHYDRKTWFVMHNHPREIIEWSPSQLKSKIDDLYNDGGNNVVFNPSVIFDPDSLSVISHSPYIDITPRIDETKKQLIKTLLPNIDITKKAVDQ